MTRTRTLLGAAALSAAMLVVLLHRPQVSPEQHAEAVAQCRSRGGAVDVVVAWSPYSAIKVQCKETMK